jgi:hypothetical protein
MLAAVSGDDLVTTLREWSGDAGCENTVFLDAFDRARHGFVVADAERVIFKRVQLIERQFDNLLSLLGIAAVGRLKQVIVRCQT